MKRCVSTRLALRERNRVASDGARKPKGSSLLAHRPRRERTEHCAICLEHFQLPDCKQEEERPHSIALINRCKHMFHQHCWAAYVKTHIQMRAFSGTGAELRCPVCRRTVGEGCDSSHSVSTSSPAIMTWLPRQRQRPRVQMISQIRKALAMWRGLEQEILNCEKNDEAMRTADILLGIIRRWTAEEEIKLASLQKETAFSPSERPLA